MKLDFEVAVDQQIKAHDQTFEGVPDSGCPSVPAGQPRPYLVNFRSFLPNHLNMLKTMLWGALLVPEGGSTSSHGGGKYSARKKRQTGTILVNLGCLQS